MWDRSVETVLDQRQRPVPPVLVRRPESPAAPVGMPDEWRVHATGSDRTVHREVLSLIRSAEQVVVFSSFLLSDSEIQRELLSAAARGCRVYGMISAEAKLDRDTSDEDSFEARTAEAHGRMLDVFFGRVFVRSSPSFHAKCVLIDPGTNFARGLLLTANLTTEALTRNEELAVRIGAAESAALFAQLRFAMWELAERELVGPGKVDPVRPLGELELPATEHTIQTTMGGRSQIRDTILAMIAAARGKILVSSYGWDAEHPVVEALCQRASQGLPVTVLARYRAVSTPALLKLRRSGAGVVCLPWLHAKALVCDGEALVMSANLQRHGMDDGFELGVRLSGSDAAALEGILNTWSGSAPWQLETPAVLGELGGFIVPLGPTPPPKLLDSTIEVKPSTTVTLPDLIADSADRVAEAAHPEPVLRREIEKNGLAWVHSIQFQYRVRAPRLPATAKAERTKKEGGAEKGDDSGPRVYRLPDGSRVVGIASPAEGKAGRAVAESLGIRQVLVMETAQ